MASSIVVEILREDNYEYWSGCMRNHLLAHDLWDIIQDNLPNVTEPPPNNQAIADEVVYITEDDLPNSTEHPRNNEAIATEAKAKAWRKKNARALHAIQISCRPDIFFKIGNPDSAKIAWDNLANLFRNPLQQQVRQVLHDNYAQHADLVKYVHGGDWHSTRSFLDQHPEAINAKISSFEWTALHMATSAGKVEIVGKLVDLMSPVALAIQNSNGDTALHLAALYGITKMARFMIEKDEEKRLVSIANKRGSLPLTIACANGHRDATIYLLSQTPFQLLSIQYQHGTHGSQLLQCAIAHNMLDLALEILYHYPSLAITIDVHLNNTPLRTLSASPDIFPSGSHLGFWQQLIYSCIHVRAPITDNSVDAHILNQSKPESKTITQQVLGKLRGICISFLKFSGMKQIYDLKMTHAYSSMLLHRMCEQVSGLDETTSNKIGVTGVLGKATEVGAVEFIEAMAKVYPMALYTADVYGRTPMMLSVVYRQEKVFNLFCYYGLDPYGTDTFGNTILHLAGMPSPFSPVSRISGAALQMQRDLQWYKKVESFNQYTTNNLRQNMYGDTPAQAFTKSHKQLVTEGEKWMKDTATSCTVVGALISTIMFAAAFTLPGGNVQDIGVPIFLHKMAFKTFIMSDTISLFSSSTSVMTFLGILTSRYGEQDFLLSLPRKLIIGLSTLFISIVAMMVAFCAALIVMLEGTMELIVPIVSLACVPVTLFMFLQFPLLVEIFMSTYGPSLFKTPIEKRNV